MTWARMKEFISQNITGVVLTLLLTVIAQYIDIRIMLTKSNARIEILTEIVAELKAENKIFREEQLRRSDEIEWVQEHRAQLNRNHDHEPNKNRN